MVRIQSPRQRHGARLGNGPGSSIQGGSASAFFPSEGMSTGDAGTIDLSASELRPLILVTNDDGIEAWGIEAVAEALSDLGDVVVVAPDRNRSGYSHMISLMSPIRCREVRPGWWASEGSPADCVYLGVVELCAKRRVSLVVSGINAGPNLSHDVHYSGTVAGAVEGTLFEISSIAVSLADPVKGSYDFAARFTRNLAASLLKNGGLPIGTTAPSAHGGADIDRCERDAGARAAAGRNVAGGIDCGRDILGRERCRAKGAGCQ